MLSIVAFANVVRLSPMPSRRVLKASSSNVSSASPTPNATPSQPQRKKLAKQETSVSPIDETNVAPAFTSAIQSTAIKNIITSILSFIGPAKEDLVKQSSTPDDASGAVFKNDVTDEPASRRPSCVSTAPAEGGTINTSQPTTRPGTTTSVDSAVPQISSPPLASVANMLLPLKDSIDCETMDEARSTPSQGAKSGRALKLPDLVIPTHPSQMTDTKQQTSRRDSNVPISPLSVNSAVVPNLTIMPPNTNAKLSISQEHNEIWVPPPSHLIKKVPNTVLIFPLRTANQSTMTDPPEPDTVLEPEKDEAKNEVTAESSVSTVLPEPEPSFEEYMRKGLESSENPLLFLYEIFRGPLPELHRVSFLQAATFNLQDTFSSSKNKAFVALFENVYHDLQRIEYSIMNSLNVLQSCEESMKNVIVVLESKPEITTAFYDKVEPIAKYNFCIF